MKLKEKEILEIKEALIRGVDKKTIASQYGLSLSTVYCINNGKAHSKTTGVSAGQQLTSNSCHSLSKEQVARVVWFLTETEKPLKTIASIFGVNRSVISNINLRKSYKPLVDSLVDHKLPLRSRSYRKDAYDSRLERVLRKK